MKGRRAASESERACTTYLSFIPASLGFISTWKLLESVVRSTSI